MRAIKLAAAMPVVAALAWAAPAAATLTVSATVNSFSSAAALNWTVVRPGGNIAQTGVLTSRMNATASAGTYPYTLLGGTTLGGFVAFCLEPMEFVPVGTSVDYNVVQLPRGASGLGGIGTTKANLIRELFGRNAPAGGFATMTERQSIAFQLAIWEIVMESASTTPRNVNQTASPTARGNFYVRPNASVTVANAFNDANSWLGQLDGTGPMARGLVVLQNGTFGVQGGGSQDLLAFAGVPEPSSWAMLITGFGLVGASLRRRRAQAA